MSIGGSAIVFFASLAGVIGGSVLLSRALSSVGKALDIPEQFLGFITALGADSPEISSSVVAMLSGQKDVGAGVVFGSNLFNLATLLGLAAVIAGPIRVRKGTVMLNGGVGFVVTALAVLLVFQYVPRTAAVVCMVVIPIPYVALLWMRRPRIEGLPLPRSWTSFLASATGECQEHARQIQENEDSSEPDTRRDVPNKMKLFVQLAGSLALIVGCSIGLVQMAPQLTRGWMPHALLGPIFLAALTGIPNLYTAARLAVSHKGAAVLTEAMNSNLLNIVAGLAIPALVLGDVVLAPSGSQDTLWLLGLTLAAIGLTARRGGLSRLEGAALIAGYCAFVVVRVHAAL